jgi:protein-disulfide isomerase
MKPFYREESRMQPSLPTSKLRPILSAVALCAAGAAAYFLMSPAKPLVLAPAVLATVTPADSFTRIAGKGARPVHIFISVDCSFCRQIESQLAHVDNVKVHYHLLPGHSADARKDSRKVWCAEDQAGAWSTFARGGAVAPAQCDDAALDRNHSLALKLGLDRTPAIVFADGRVLAGALSTDILERELASSEAGTAK